MSVKEWKVLLQKSNIKPNTNDVLKYFHECDLGQKAVDSSQLKRAYDQLSISKELVNHYQWFFHGKLHLSASDFQKFLLEQQKDAMAGDLEYVHEHMVRTKDVSTLQSPGEEPSLTINEFLDYLFDPRNSVFEERGVDQDMTKPLSWYWISSSHNTYLTGNHITTVRTVIVWQKDHKW